MNVHSNTILRYNRRPASAQVVSIDLCPPDYPLHVTLRYNRQNGQRIPILRGSMPDQSDDFSSFGQFLQLRSGNSGEKTMKEKFRNPEPVNLAENMKTDSTRTTL
jgi:hypothetical protein